jgi:hypothetical protein
MTTDPRRGKIVAYCEWSIQNAALIHYTQNQAPRLASLAKPRKLPLATDCSGLATCAYKDAGGPNPNTKDGRWTVGAPFYTGTMLECGEQVAKPEAGDLLIYGPYPGHHVVVFLEVWHGAWIVCSHGQEIGPLRMLQHREEQYQGYKPVIRSYLPR